MFQKNTRMFSVFRKNLHYRAFPLNKLYFQTSSAIDQQPPQEQRQQKVKTDEKTPKVKTFAQRKFLGFLTRYIDKNVAKIERVFEKRSPELFKIYKRIKYGLWDILADTRQCYKVTTRTLSNKQLCEFSRTELDNYRQIPSDMLRVAPVLLISFIPGGNIIFIPVFLYPNTLGKKFLCRHFWTPEQRLQFAEDRLRNRIRYYPKVFSFLERESYKINDEGLRRIFQRILWKLEQGIQPEVEEILDTRTLFTNKPFSFDVLYRRHRIYMQWNLSHSWNFPGRKSAMFEDANLLHCTNIAMRREGLSSMSFEELQHACVYRGLMASGLSEEHLRQYLHSWVQISQNLGESDFSLLLHSHVLLSYGHPNNHKYLLKNVDVTRGVIKQEPPQS